MHTIQSFTVVANLVERNCAVRYDELRGLTIDGLTMNEARLAIHVLEKLSESKELLVAVAQGRDLVVADAPPRPAPVQPDGTPNRAQWGPVTQPPTPSESPPVPADPAPAPDEPPEPAVDGPDDAEGTVAPPEPPDAHEGTEAPSEDPPADPADTGAECAHDDPEVPPEIDTPADPVPEPPAPKPSRRRKGKKAPPRVEDLKDTPEPSGLLARGDMHEGVKILDHKDHGDGGRLLIRADGTRVKISSEGDEVTRIAGEPPDVSDVPTADTLVTGDESPPTSGEVETNPTARHAYPVPPELLETRMTREVVQHLIDHGVTEKDSIIDECVKLKGMGAKAFENSKDDEAVRRRVTSTLTVMGRG